MPTATQDLHQLLLRSEKFRRWRVQERKPAVTVGRGQPFVYKGKPFVYKGKRYTNLMANERRYTPAELAELWGVSSETIRQVFRNEPGVLRVGSNGSTKTRKYILQRIPESVAQRVHKHMSAIPAAAE